MVKDVHRTVSIRLDRADYRYTSGRQSLVGILAHAGQPMSMPEILAAARLPQSSAYRNLTVLENAGVVRRIVTHDDFCRYELAEDLTGHHHHLVCESCGLVEDFTLSKDFEASLDSTLTRTASKRGLEIVGHRLDVYGLCQTCRDKARRGRRGGVGVGL
jgi:Fur family transcriptional regulator, ferric uptake regulator